MNKNYASFGQRLIAHLIDYLLGWVVTVWYLFELSRQSELEGVLNILLSALLAMIWYGIVTGLVISFLTSKFGGSLGKLLTGLRVVDEHGKYLTFWKAFFRELGLKAFVSGHLFCLGYFWMIKDANKQTWHDKAAGTYVVTVNKSLTFIGLLVVLSLIGINGYLINQMVQVVNQNAPLYQDFSETFTKSFQEALKEELTPSPSPKTNIKVQPNTNLQYQYKTN